MALPVRRRLIVAAVCRAMAVFVVQVPVPVTSSIIPLRCVSKWE